MNTKKAQNVTIRGTQMTRKAAVLFALKESRHSGTKADIIWSRRVAAVCAFQELLYNSIKLSKKISTPVAMMAQVKI